jgi:hypothetical protein
VNAGDHSAHGGLVTSWRDAPVQTRAAWHRLAGRSASPPCWLPSCENRMIRSCYYTNASAAPHRGSARSRGGRRCFYLIHLRCLSGIAKRFHHCTQPTRAHGSLRSVHPTGTLVRGIVRIDARGLPSAYPRGVYLGKFPRCDRGAVDQPPHLVRRGLSNQHLAPRGCRGICSPSTRVTAEANAGLITPLVPCLFTFGFSILVALHVADKDGVIALRRRDIDFHLNNCMTPG